LRDSQLRERFGVMIVAIKKPSGHMVYNPPGEARLEAEDILIVLGPRQQLDELDQLANG
jgi:voltage-gated potassium channel